MGKICTLAIPTSIEGINTTIDVGSGCIHHAVFDSGINRNRMYSIIRNSDFRSSHVHLTTDNLQEYMNQTMDYVGMTITPHVRDTVSEFVALLYSLKSEVDIRYSTLNDTNNKNFEYYNIWLDPKHYYKMESKVICWIGADKVLKQMNHEETYELLKTF